MSARPISAEVHVYSEDDLNELLTKKTNHEMTHSTFVSINNEVIKGNSHNNFVMEYVKEFQNDVYQIYLFYVPNGTLAVSDLTFTYDSGTKFGNVRVTNDTLDDIGYFILSLDANEDWYISFAYGYVNAGSTLTLSRNGMDDPFANSFIYDKTNNLGFFLTDIANAIREKKPVQYSEKKEIRYAQLNTLFDTNTGFGYEEQTDLSSDIIVSPQNAVQVFVTTRKRVSARYLDILIGMCDTAWNGQALYVADFSFSYNSGTGTISITNNSGRDVKFRTYCLTDQTIKWGEAYGGDQMISNGATFTLDNVTDFQCDPFRNAKQVIVDDSINAQDFADEIRALEFNPEPTPTPISSYITVETETSVVPPPYDANGYNYNSQAPAKVNEIEIELGDLSGYSSITFSWDNENSANNYGVIRGWYEFNGDEVDIYNDLEQSGNITINCSSINEIKTITFHVYAKSSSSYRGYISRAVLHVLNLTIS